MVLSHFCTIIYYRQKFISPRLKYLLVPQNPPTLVLVGFFISVVQPLLELPPQAVSHRAGIGTSPTSIRNVY
jgi:hypothetical protein